MIVQVKFAKDAGAERTVVSSRDTAVPSPAPSVESLGPDHTSASSRSGYESEEQVLHVTYKTV